jgi:uncharacterized protein (TIGR02611 family)
MPPEAVFRSLLVFDEKHPFFPTYKVAKRIVIGIVGGTVLALGFIMILTPGPGIAGILAGLGILAIEFAWARIWLKKIKAKAVEVAQGFSSNRKKNTVPGEPPTRDAP